MFQKTRIKLTVLNSCVFILLISVLGSVIYMYVRNHMFDDVDRNIMDAIHRVEKAGLVQQMHDPRLRLLIWGNDKIISNIDGPDEYIFEKNASKFMPHQMNEFQDIEVDDSYFRTFSVKAIVQGKTVTLQFVENIDGEMMMLHKLMLITIIGCVLAGIFAVIAGFILAERALKPIKRSWEKQQQFVSDASHELRTPLAVIQSRAELLLQKPAATIQDQISNISVVLKECRRLTKLVANLLTLARSDSNEIEIEKKEFYLDELLKEITEHFSEVASIQGKEIVLKSAPPITFIGDRDRIHQLIVILLDNAMKYTDEHGTIQLSCFEEKNHVGLMVKDNGIGIKEEDQVKIFDRFYQVSKSRTKTDSLGLGLSIAQWIVEKHGGKIKVESKFGEGTTFIITFSKKKIK
ncbi:sensor histidine kinase [Heyndrickxia ginsengihumi]|uniref:histidine kinase n=1 Tax=Heyndrickxia ginsengihumi TaxID=363870 RepID=A0A0A6VAV1_9BACI|nr:HAMP domain-containing sensor histidine kinase [Heyndrickxia ginsengihumi]KHD84633.1 histidine kinase [Heyndrickxia ginsengihumi]MCM3024971.1 HAMP domain-containing histidine kinase [Heyndrickxia ginsengihumi]NEY19106.1 HAMP domain-containing histidine kinase [Heyndrickxia ginsengihumi]